MLNVPVRVIARVIIYCLLIGNIWSQPFYYDDERTYYHDADSPNEMYNLDTVEHNQDGSMRALAGVVADKDATTISYYDEFQNVVTDVNSFDPTQHSSTETIKNSDHNFVDVDKTVSVHNKNENSQYEDSLKNAFKTTKQNDINSALSQLKEARPTSPRTVNDSMQKNLLRQSIQTEKVFTNEKQNKSLLSERNDFKRYSANTGTDVNEVWPRIGVKNNVISQRNLSSTFDHQIIFKNDSRLNVLTNNSGACDASTHSGCDVIHYERCDPEIKQCRCLNGFFPERSVLGTGHCRAVTFYHGHLKVTSPRSNQRFSNEQMVFIKQKLMFMIGQSLKKWGLDVILDLNIRSVELKDHHTSLTFEVGLNKEVFSGDDNVQLALNRDVVVTPQGELLVETSEHFSVGRNGSSSPFSPLVEVNSCISSDHNHCSRHASCSYLHGVVSCQCNPGYEDLTPNLYRLPGEVCIEKCHCLNGGICVDAGTLSDTRQCSCLKWYFGSICQIDGKELMLICCCSIGSVVLLCLTMCCCCYGCVKHRDNMARSSMFSLSPDISILKLPRVWMDTSGYNDHELSPHSQRRMSVTSESNPYYDGYIMGDVSLGTLQRDRGNHPSYYQVSQTSLGHCPATMSSHSFYRY